MYLGWQRLGISYKGTRASGKRFHMSRFCFLCHTEFDLKYQPRALWSSVWTQNPVCGTLSPCYKIQLSRVKTTWIIFAKRPQRHAGIVKRNKGNMRKQGALPWYDGWPAKVALLVVLTKIGHMWGGALFPGFNRTISSRGVLKRGVQNNKKKKGQRVYTMQS